MPDLIIIAGPNGAGKSTIFPAIQNSPRFEGSFQPGKIADDRYINPDDLARNNNLGELAAGRLALQMTKRFIEAKDNFAIETTMSGSQILNTIREAKNSGYKIFIIYVSLYSHELSVARVVQRALLGRHYIPLDFIIRRFRKSMENFVSYRQYADFWLVVDNSELIPSPLVWGGNIYVNSINYAYSEQAIQMWKQRASAVLTNLNNLVYSLQDEFSPQVFRTIQELVQDEISRRPKGNYVVTQKEGKIVFEPATNLNE